MLADSGYASIRQHSGGDSHYDPNTGTTIGGLTDELWPLFDQACRNSPHWLVQHWWEPAERFTLQALKAQDVTIDTEGFGYARSRKRKVDCNAVHRLMDSDFVRSTGGKEITWAISTKVACPPIHEPKHSHWPRMRDALPSSQWELLLCSAGGLAALLCPESQSANRLALDIGAFDIALLQDSPFRTQSGVVKRM